MFSSKIRSDAFEVEAPGNPEYEVEVVANSGDSIVLSLESDNHHLLEAGIRGVAWVGGVWPGGHDSRRDGRHGDASIRSPQRHPTCRDSRRHGRFRVPGQSSYGS